MSKIPSYSGIPLYLNTKGELAMNDIGVNDKTLRMESLKTLIDRDIKAIKKCELIDQAKDYINDLDMAVKSLFKQAEDLVPTSFEQDPTHFKPYYRIDYRDSDYTTIEYSESWHIVDFQEVISNFLSCIDEYGTVVAIIPKEAIISIERISNEVEDDG